MVVSNQQTKNKIMAGALTLFFSAPVKHFTMEGVAEMVGISKRTLYKYFSSKEILVDSLIENILSNVKSIFTNATEEEKHPVKQFVQIMNKITIMGSKMPMKRLAELKLHYPLTWEKVEKFRLEREQDWYHIFMNGQKKGYFKKDIDVAILAKIHTNIINSIFQPEFLISNQTSVMEIFPVMLKMMTGGIITSKGQVHDIDL